MPELVQYQISGRSASAIAADVEAAVARGDLPPDSRLPSVRGLAAQLSVSAATVAAAFAQLRRRGVVVSRERSGVRVSPRPPLASPVPTPPEPGARDLASGNPDPALLPNLADFAEALQGPPRLYGEEAVLPALANLARTELRADEIEPQRLTVTSGALDALERLLVAELRPGDRVALEDPCYVGVLDLVRALGLVPIAVPVDAQGPIPAGVTAAVTAGARAFVCTPRAQNPSGAAVSAQRALRLAAVLSSAPGLLVVEDDHAGLVAGGTYHSTVGSCPRWAVVRSVNKALGPDLRLAVVAGDPTTIARMEGRHRLGAGWVSWLLQRLVAALWSDPTIRRDLAAAGRIYAARQSALVQTLTGQGVAATGSSGFNVWIPVPQEAPVVRGLSQRGWSVRAGEPFRLNSPPAIRVTTATLETSEAEHFAGDLIAVLRTDRGRTNLA